jgi:CubicO group peptidase (beta-lactamase class C family)/ATP-dependent Clp protease adapter protein ClpS
MTSTSANAGPLPERVEKAAQERIAAGTYQTLVFGVVDGDRSEVVSFGKLDDGKAPDGDTVYEIGSITKTFTATLLAQVVLAGRLMLDTPVAQLLADFKIPSGGDKEITLGDLATHHSGLPRMPSNFAPKDLANPYADYDAAKLKAFLAEYQLPRDPGASYEYSNLGFGLLGQALAQCVPTTYGTLTNDEILKPLGMTMSGTAFTDAMRAHLAPGHDDTGKAAKNWDLDVLAGAGALRSTANDMLRYLKANMGIGQSPLAAAMNLAQQPRSDMTKTVRIGLAWMTTDKGIIWHNGGTGGYRSFLGFTANRERGVIILTNTSADPDDLGFATLDADAPLAPAYRAIVLPSALLDDYVGIYELSDKVLLMIYRSNGGLCAQATGQGPIHIFPSAPDEFFAKVAGISMTFNRNPEGAVDGLVLHQNGDRAAPKRIKAKETESHSVSDIESGLLSKVRLLNDDYTPMDFVVFALQWVFGKDLETATRIMLEIHNEGAGACGIYPHHVADAKVTEVLDLAREHKHPLQCVRERITSAPMKNASSPVIPFSPMPAGDPESLGFSTTRLERIASWYQARVDGGDLPGAVVGIARNGKLAYLRAIGFQDRGKTIPMRSDAIFWIASMTKPVTSVAAMILVEQGKLDLDAPVSLYLPELANMQVATEETGTTELVLAPPKRPMTVRDLLRHTSGLIYPPQYIDSRIHRLYGEKIVFTRDTSLAEFVASLGKLPLAHQPGEVWEYSLGVDVLARIVEVASGQPFHQYLQARIFGPLHMIDTGFYVPQAKLSRLVDPASEGRPALWDVTKQPRLFSGGGGLVSTTADYLRFCQMLLNGGDLDGARILSPETVQLMTTNSLPPDIRFAQGMNDPAGWGASWGFGFAIRTNPEASHVPGSVGSFTLGGWWGTVFWIDPAEKLIAVQMIQVAPDASDPYRTAFRNLTYGALLIPERPVLAVSEKPIAVDTKTLADYIGTYDFGLTTSSRDRQGPPVDTGRRVGIQFEVEDRGPRLTWVLDGAPASKAGVRVGDVVTHVDGMPTKGLTSGQLDGKIGGPAGTEVDLTIEREDVDRPLQVTVMREVIYGPTVKLQVRLEASKFTIESTGGWPILDFEEGKPVAVTAMSSTEFYVDNGDHTRIAFVRDAAGEVSAAVLNPGPRQQSGVRLD